MRVLGEYYPFQLLLKLAGLAPYRYGLFFENRFRYSWIILFYSSCQTIMNCGYVLSIVWGIVYIVRQTLNSDNAIEPSVAPHRSTDMSDVLMLIVNPILNNVTAIICRVCAILTAPKMPRIFESIDGVDRLLRTTPGKSSRRYFLGLVLAVLFMCFGIHLPLCYASFIIEAPTILGYLYMNTFAAFTGMCGEWTQVSLFALLKKRFATINRKLDELCRRSMDEDEDEDEKEEKKRQTTSWSKGGRSLKAKPSGRRRLCPGRMLFGRKREDSRATVTFARRIVPILGYASNDAGFVWTDFDVSVKRPWRFPDGVTALELEALRLAHQELCSTMSRINDLFQFQNLCLFCACFFHGLDNLYYAIQETLIRLGIANPPEEIPLFRHPVFAAILAFHFYFRIMSFGRSVSTTNLEAKRASEYLEGLKLLTMPPEANEETRQELDYFERHMASRPNKFSACGIIDFEGSLILRVINTVINYIFLMLQQPVRYT